MLDSFYQAVGLCCARFPALWEVHLLFDSFYQVDISQTIFQALFTKAVLAELPDSNLKRQILKRYLLFPNHLCEWGTIPQSSLQLDKVVRRLRFLKSDEINPSKPVFHQESLCALETLKFVEVILKEVVRF